MGRPMEKKSLFVMMLMAWVFHAWASEYVVVLVSGELYRCQSRYVVDPNGMVRFRLTSGPEMAVPKSKVAWYETAQANGEQPPAGSKPVVKAKTKSKHPSKMTLPKLVIPMSQLKSELRSVIDGGFSLGALISMSLMTWLVALFLALVGYLLASSLFWYILNLFGEPNVFWGVVGLNLLLFLSAGLIYFLTSFSPIEPLTTIIVAAFLNLVVSSSIVISIFDCELSAAVMSVLVYQIVFGLFSFGGFKLLSLWIG